MGAWGTAMDDNDSAGDAAEEFRRNIVVSKDGWKTIRNTARLAFNAGNTLGVLGIAKLLLDFRSDFARSYPLQVYVAKSIALELSTTDEWRSPARRKKALKKFARQWRAFTRNLGQHA